MGWGLKAGIAFLALVAAVFGAWIVAIPALAVLFLPPLLNKGKRTASGSASSKNGHGRMVDAAGVLLIVLSGLALFRGGTLSPVVLFLLGLSLLLRCKLSEFLSSRVVPVEGSILVKRGLLPGRWSAVAEVKVSTKDIEGALSGVAERLLYVSDPTPRIFLFFSTGWLRRPGAEEVLTRKMHAVARQLVPLGAYLLPLDSAEAAKAATIRAQKVPVKTENLRQLMATADFGAVVVQAKQGFVTGFELYMRPDQSEKAKPVVSGKARDAGLLTLREFLHETCQRLGAPQPDRYTTFLSSMAATEGEALGQRMTHTSQGKQEQTLLVASVGSPQVELTRAQLRAVSAIYQ